MKTCHGIFATHGELVLARSQRAREAIAASLTKAGARPLNLGVCQMRNGCGGTEGKRQNLERMLSAIAAAGAARVQVLVFPEMCLPGYFTSVSGTTAEAAAANRELADAVPGSLYVQALQEAASKAGMVLAFGFSEREDDRLYNAIGVIDADGTWLGTRRKTPLSPSPYETGSFAEPGVEARAVVFRTRYATVGVSNCFDGEFPESIRRMRLAGAEVLLWCNAATGDARLGHSNRLNYSGVYAQSNNIWVACCNCVAENAYGTSVIMSRNGEPLVILPTDEEGLGVATVDLAATATWEPWQSRVDRQGYR